DTSTETSYSVAILADDASTIICPSQILPAGSTTHLFAGCSLPSGEYYAEVWAHNALSSRQAENSPYHFTVSSSNSAPTAFNILGVSGGQDLIPDRALSSGLLPTIHWEDSLGESTYELTIYENDGLTIKC